MVFLRRVFLFALIRGGNRWGWRLPEDITRGRWAGQFASGRLLGGKLVDVCYGIVFIEYTYHARPVYKGLGYALRIYFFYAKLPDKQYIEHRNRELAGTELAAELRE
ncbi:MAG TPA: hypothetical protein VFO93_18090 [Hymenobacter sp.]|uniref:hypothetical protein n=1 Tax=Hymenobacter sp. TaxID=1898978 RepID=UPI002D7F3BAF|nr:hypothetical protein [Hymenobacter sp.]HET9505459.1 hypothetical protein [Hymenobacter sp.]